MPQCMTSDKKEQGFQNKTSSLSPKCREFIYFEKEKEEEKEEENEEENEKEKGIDYIGRRTFEAVDGRD